MEQALFERGSMFDVTLITPTGDRPLAFRLAERWMGRQSFRGSTQWIVVDDGELPTGMTMGQQYVRREHDSRGHGSLMANMLEALSRVDSRRILIIEDDDYYKPHYVASAIQQLDTSQLAGNTLQLYYHLSRRRWKTYRSNSPSLCQTGFHDTLIPVVIEACHRALEKESISLDIELWRLAQKRKVRCHAFEGTVRMVGMKGLPGRTGLGKGHRPGQDWHEDDELAVLRHWTGGDFPNYEPLCIGPIS
jgi:hypothetical protein